LGWSHALTEEDRIQVVASLAHGSACPRSLIQPELNHLRAAVHSDQPSDTRVIISVYLFQKIER
jgi:hypothetical protein